MMMNIKKPAHSRINALSVAKMLKALLEGPTSIYELTDVSGLHIHTIRAYMNAMVKEKCAYVSGWEKDSRNCDNIRIFSLGYGRNVARSRKSKAQIAKESRDRKKAGLLAKAFSFDNVISIKDGMYLKDSVIHDVNRSPLITEKPLTDAEIWGTARKKCK